VEEIKMSAPEANSYPPEKMGNSEFRENGMKLEIRIV
jgi:hypothetical protein